MNTNKELALVSFEQAKRLKELGFDWECDSFYWGGGEDDDLCYQDIYDNHNSDKLAADYEIGKYGEIMVCSVPTVALALMWFRNKKGFIGEVRHYVEKRNILINK